MQIHGDDSDMEAHLLPTLLNTASSFSFGASDRTPASGSHLSFSGRGSIGCGAVARRFCPGRIHRQAMTFPNKAFCPKSGRRKARSYLPDAKRFAADDASDPSAGTKRATETSPPGGAHPQQRETSKAMLKLGKCLSVDSKGTIWQGGRTIGYWGVNGHEFKPWSP
jgi:hypothetical protein